MSAYKPEKKRQKMDEYLFAEAKGIQEAKIEVFKGTNVNKAFVSYDDAVYDIGFLDLYNNEKTHLEECLSTDQRAHFTVDSDKITVSIDRINLNRLTAEETNNEYIQFSKQSSLVKYKNNYYFIHDFLAKDLRRYAIKYGKDAADIAFVFPDNQIKLDADQLKLTQDTQRRVRKFDIFFGTFEFNAPILVDDTIKRYVINNSDQLIEIDDYLVKDFKLETAVQKIDIKASFTPTDSIPAQMNPIICKAYRRQMPSYINIAEHNVPTELATSSAEVNVVAPVTTLPIELDKHETTSTERKKNRIYFGLNVKPLKETRVSEIIREIVHGIENDDTKAAHMALRKHYEQAKSNEGSYLRVMSDCIDMELAHQLKDVEKFNMSNVKMISTEIEDEFHLVISNEKDSHRLKNAIHRKIIDGFELKPINTFQFGSTMKGSILCVEFERIRVKITKNELSARENSNYEIKFQINTIPFDVQHMALDYVKEHKLFGLLIESRTFNELNTDDHAIIVFDDESFDSNLNAEQSIAVEYITQKSKPLPPYILYGPPGTGKTKTLVAAIEKIIKTTEQNVLVCAQTNQACDELAERLMKCIDHNVMLRMYAKTFSVKKVSKRFQKISNLNEESESFELPDLKCLYGYRAVICTLCTANCLVRARNHKLWKVDHFDFVIIDECANTHETTAFVSIAGLVTKEGEVCAKIVLAGDPQQLEAVTKSQDAVDLGYSKSYFEYLMELKPYQPNPDYDQRFITLLTKNYRSHKSILSVPNELFYGNRLEATAPPDITDWFIGSKILESKNHPIKIFSVRGKCLLDDNSWINMMEIQKVIEIVTNLVGMDLPNANRRITQEDIGIISPYRGQVQALSRNIRFKNVQIGTTENFQGSEKPVIIISTVRTNGEIGFLKNPRRFNVAVTRAKCLLIIVGDIKTLEQEENWDAMIQFCSRNGCIEQ